eukprot:CAMPEP_0198595926 /NCGR_PEP_ID=MMETSP1462-20131121/142490_1 /TAXON_ID=1333877 /ORGANISM="Brandtodinium nutriculum, Strain RCC3387" /LENGTH=46 /DNA_ID= /DNA_START= /DNA_END= /DNA_ORIENTATION=
MGQVAMRRRRVRMTGPKVSSWIAKHLSSKAAARLCSPCALRTEAML